MSTRGAFGFICKGKEKIGYNHFDSYPNSLGRDILYYLKCNTIEKLRHEFDDISMDNYDEDVWDEAKRRPNRNFTDNSSFLKDSLMCEHAYIINIDTGMLEYYTGFNKDPDAPGRYAKYTVYEDAEEDDRRYYGVKLDLEIPLTELFNGSWEIEENKFIKKEKAMQETVWHTETPSEVGETVLLKFKGGEYSLGTVRDDHIFVVSNNCVEPSEVQKYIYVEELK